MKRTILNTILLSLLALAMVPLSAQTLSDKDREYLINHLQKTRQILLEEVKGLSKAQANFKPGAESWSVAECVEHIALSEDLILSTVTDQVMQTPATPERKPEMEGKDEQILKIIVDRSQKAQAPAPIQPKGTWNSLKEAIAAFQEKRKKTLEFSRSTQEDLRSHIFPHPAPVIGDLDAYQWLLFLSGHSERHTLQIQEVKAHPDFPGN